MEPKFYQKRFMKYMKSIMISNEAYKKQSNLSMTKFGDENVLLYPPRKVVNQNMRTMRDKKHSLNTTFASRLNSEDTMMRVGSYNLMDNTINSECEEDDVYQLVHVQEDVACDVEPMIKLSRSYQKDRA